MRKWNVIVRAKGSYGWTADVFTIQAKRTLHGAVSAGLRGFLDRGELDADEKPITDEEFQEVKITCQLREEKVA